MPSRYIRTLLCMMCQHTPTCSSRYLKSMRKMALQLPKSRSFYSSQNSRRRTSNSSTQRSKIFVNSLKLLVPASKLMRSWLQNSKNKCNLKRKIWGPRFSISFPTFLLRRGKDLSNVSANSNHSRHSTTSWSDSGSEGRMLKSSQPTLRL